MSKNPFFLTDTKTKPESQQVKAYELRVYKNVSLKTVFPQAIVEIGTIKKKYHSIVKNISVCLQKVLDKSGIEIREGFRFQIPFSGRLSNL